MLTSSQILYAIRDFLDGLEFQYELLEERDAILVRMPLEGKLKQVNAYFACRDGSYTVNAYIELNAAAECRRRVAEYITRANYGLRYGNFEMDFDDGEIRYRLTLDCRDREYLSSELIGATLAIPAQMFVRYSDGLIAVIYGIQTPEAAIQEAEEDLE